MAQKFTTGTNSSLGLRTSDDCRDTPEHSRTTTGDARPPCFEGARARWGDGRGPQGVLACIIVTVPRAGEDGDYRVYRAPETVRCERHCADATAYQVQAYIQLESEDGRTRALAVAYAHTTLCESTTSSSGCASAIGRSLALTPRIRPPGNVPAARRNAVRGDHHVHGRFIGPHENGAPQNRPDHASETTLIEHHQSCPAARLRLPDTSAQ